MVKGFESQLKYFKVDSGLDRKPVQLDENWCYVVKLVTTC